jgi:hypothetical protein
MSWWSILFIFMAGFLSGLATWIIYRALSLLADVHAARESTAHYLSITNRGEVDQAALDAVKRCKNKLRWQRNPNPEWLPPLIEAIPDLVREIAAIYHPSSPRPLLSPGLSQFSMAVHLTALDIATFLQTRSIGRLIDVSANTALRTWEISHKVVQHEAFQTAGKWYRRALPLWQAIRYKSPIMWASMAASNIATRTLQPAIIDIVARRAIDLYSGRLTPPPPAPPPAP